MKLRPIRPKPLIPTLIFAIVSIPFVVADSSLPQASVTGRLRAKIGTFPQRRRGLRAQAGGPGSSEDDPPGPSPPLETWRQTGSESAAGRARTRRVEYTTPSLPR